MTSLKVIASFVSISLILLLVAAGPARAFIFDFAIDNKFPLLGDLVNFQVSAEIEPGEQIDIQTLTLDIQGPQSLNCEFYPNATPISPCPGLSITNLETTSYQYGYGFFPGFLRYDIVLDSGTLQNGDYEARLVAHTLTDDIETPSQDLMIVSLSNQVERCSIRAEEGEVEIEGDTFDGRNKLSLFTSKGNSRNSRGSFTAQQRRERISYKFTVDDARRTTGDVIYFDVHGEFSINRQKTMRAATMIFNTKTFELEIRGDDFNVSGMSVNFARC